MPYEQYAIALPDGRAAACGGLGVTTAGAACVCGDARYRRFCPCEQQGCHPPHPLIFVSQGHPQYNCNGFYWGGWCYIWQEDEYLRHEIDDVWGRSGLSYLVVEPGMAFDAVCNGGCGDVGCRPEGDTCECGDNPCANLCYEYVGLDSQGHDAYCCLGELDRFGNATHDWTYYELYTVTNSWTEGCVPGCNLPPGSDLSCVFYQAEIRMTGREQRNGCQVQKEVIRDVLHSRGGTDNVCGEDHPYTGSPVWMDEPGMTLGQRSTGWVLDYSNPICGCTSYGEHNDSEYGSCTYRDFLHQEHVYSCSYWGADNPEGCCVGCTLDQRITIHRIVTKTPGPDSQGCCGLCICRLLGMEDCQLTGGGRCPEVPDPGLPGGPPATPMDVPLPAGDLVVSSLPIPRPAPRAGQVVL